MVGERPATVGARWLPIAAGIVVVLIVLSRLGAFELWQPIAAPGGERWLPVTFASMDHPFHVARAETLRRALRDGHVPSWMADHQGGYPVEFYPMGVAWLEVGLWALFAGAVPMAIVHKWFVAIVFLVPAVVFALMAKGDRRPATVGVTAFCLHVLLPGQPLQGGYTELVYMGLVSNIAATMSALLMLPLLSAFVSDGRRPLAVAAAIAAATAVYANPRSAVALVLIGAAVMVVQGRRGRSHIVPTRVAVVRVMGVAGLAGLLAAPEIVSMARYNHLYYFVRYSSYETVGDFLRAWCQSVSLPLLMCGLGGAVAAWRVPFAPMARTAAVALAAYVGTTLAMDIPAVAVLVPQLESSRLMPFQRMLTIYLAAFMLHALLSRVPGGWVGPVRVPPATALAPVALALAIVWPAPLIPGEHQSLWAVERTATPEMLDFMIAIEGARAAAPGASAVLVIGSSLGQHQQLWAPLVASGRYFYDDWMWYWHASHVGPYDPCCESAYSPVGKALQRTYLERHGIGAIAVTGDAAAVAAASPDLEWRQAGPFGWYEVYQVRTPAPMVTWPGSVPAETRIERERVRASGPSAGGTAVVRHNWHPRWQASVNGARVPVTRSSDGYMSLPVPSGEVQLQLEYRLDAIDRIALGAVVAGWAIAVALWAAAYRG